MEEHQQTGPDEVLERLQGATIAIVNKVQLPGEVLAKLPDLKLIAVAATGTDCVDKAHCQANDIAVANIRGYALRTVPEHTFALMLALRRNIVPYREDTLAGEWQRSGQFCFFNHSIRDLGGARLGIIGEGVLGPAGGRDRQGLRHDHDVRGAQGQERPRALSTRPGTRCWRPATSSPSTAR